MKDSIDLIYVNYFNYGEIKHSVQSLYEIINDLNYKFNIFILDNSFTSVPKELIHKFNEDMKKYSKSSKLSIKFFPSNINVGFGKGCNLAVKKGSSKNIIIINPDTSFEGSNPITFSSLIKEINDQDVIIGPKILNINKLPQLSCFSFDPISIILKPIKHLKFIKGKLRFLINLKFFKIRLDRISYKGLQKNKKSYVDWVSGCFMIINRDFYEEVNGFDERFFLYFEDVDLCRKARQLGKNVVYNPKFSLIHKAKHQSRAEHGIIKSIFFNRTARYHIISWLKYILKWRRDFLLKLIYKIKGNLNTENNLLSNYYNLDFSKFRQDKK